MVFHTFYSVQFVIIHVVIDCLNSPINNACVGVIVFVGYVNGITLYIIHISLRVVVVDGVVFLYP